MRKTRQELDTLAFQLHYLLEHGPEDVNKAIELLDDLHSDGMREAAEIASDSHVNGDIAQQAILQAIAAKEKIG